jgi:GNAT superfamily N-acetyltransferase
VTSATTHSGERVRLQDLRRDYDEELLHDLYTQVLEPSFARDELEPVESIAAGLQGRREGDVLAAVALDASGKPLGGLIAERDSQTSVLLLSYIAVRPEARGRGIATLFMEHVAADWYRHPDVLLALAEVHDPRSFADVVGEDSIGRLRLYERLGARLLAVPFVQPALTEGRERIPGFLLLVFHADPRACVERDGSTGVRSEIVTDFIRRYYESAEGVTPPYDPQLAKLLQAVGARDEIPVLPISQYSRIPTGL